MKNFLLNVTILSFSLLTTKAIANEMDGIYYWSNAKGLVQADHCRLEATNDTKFRVVNDSQANNVTLKINNGLSNLSMRKKSLVKFADGDSDTNNKIVEVVSINSIEASDSTRNRFGLPFKLPFGKSKNKSKVALEDLAIRGDAGVVALSNLESPRLFTFKINNDYMNIVKDSYLKIYYDQKFIKVNCPEFSNSNEYILFNLYRDTNEGVISRVAVSASETELFKDIAIFSSTRSAFSKEYDRSNVLSDTIVLTEDREKAEQDKADRDIAIKEKAIRDKEAKEAKEAKELREKADKEGSSYRDTLSSFKAEKERLFKEEWEARYNNLTPTYNEDVSTQLGVDTIICTPEDYINVRNEDLTEVLFTVKSKDRVSVFQGWGNNEIEGYVNGKNYRFSKVEFLDREDSTQKIGYVITSSVKAKSNCNTNEYSNSNISLVPADITFKGLDDKKCCIFPIKKMPKQPFTKGTPSFGANRDNGTRTHAAVDLYREVNEPVYAVASGVVINPLYFFYLGTYALEVLHAGGFVVRYGEMTSKQVENVSYGSQLAMGDRVGHIAKINVKGCCRPMLHFELFSGKLRGPLTQENVTINGVYFARRKDLMNPTTLMLKWKNKQFN